MDIFRSVVCIENNWPFLLTSPIKVWLFTFFRILDMSFKPLSDLETKNKKTNVIIYCKPGQLSLAKSLEHVLYSFSYFCKKISFNMVDILKVIKSHEISNFILQVFVSQITEWLQIFISSFLNILRLLNWDLLCMPWKNHLHIIKWPTLSHL